ncbi:mannose-1-phosphate guanylyltransferase/mannose-6-phosphate isomerase [Telmatospirillum sp.]|uniref:mannose-1-phosphate guanylyltransferase/mannose-6-phosphate isomerase n=1 Tax=Telmatospirillum sp. TaxID=2079197 RepID=UPI002845BECA|nr:mannose-1-phosphate guanylyltransferase/mannose-6-phosphate isomerase [Telmatospirillum sp.]MDR3441153.1 mannose-1-phosphate guanylyltransferase/mannose-6-phosphate isomerase [Telmatospirillum sp.]
MTKITPVVLSGGAGTRLWPLSREHFPKQFLPLAGTRSMIQETLLRFADSSRFAPPIVVTNDETRFTVAEQLRETGLVSGGLILEPVARNTAPATAAAALLAVSADPDAILLVVPSDHVIADVAGFLKLVEQALPAALDQGRLVTFSIVPTRPETGYGYIRRGAALDGLTGVHQVAAFVEKPDAERAAAFLAAGDYFWNSGMFLFSARHFLAELERYAPDVLAAARQAVAGQAVDLDFIRLDKDAFAASPSISIDYAVMEKTAMAATVACDVGWTDVGAWSELWRIADKDGDGNALQGDVLAEQSKNCYVRSEGMLTAVVGVDDLVVVVTDDAVLVTSRDHAQDVKLVVDRLRHDKRRELKTHAQVHRPWGYYQSIHQGDRFQVKRLTIRPGGKLSLQKHYHRSEHWVVVNGTALVTCGEETRLYQENESVYIPLGCLHRLENPGRVPLNLIEVQSGSYLGEDDIVRLEDTYGRS